MRRQILTQTSDEKVYKRHRNTRYFIFIFTSNKRIIHKIILKNRQNLEIKYQLLSVKCLYNRWRITKLFSKNISKHSIHTYRYKYCQLY